jgi:cold-inducible RNA-binding protein
MNIYIGNLAQNVQEEDLNTLFSKHGKVDSVKIIRDMYSKASKGFGFIEMLVKDEAQKALDVLNTFELKGKKLVVNEARPKKPRVNNDRRYNERRY